MTGDGVLDANDGCPNDPAKTDPGLCGCGVADTDSDDDGTADCEDPTPDGEPAAGTDGSTNDQSGSDDGTSGSDTSGSGTDDTGGTGTGDSTDDGSASGGDSAGSDTSTSDQSDTGGGTDDTSDLSDLPPSPLPGPCGLSSTANWRSPSSACCAAGVNVLIGVALWRTDVCLETPSIAVDAAAGDKCRNSR